MGTHPIFESDFDCLTDRFEKDAIDPWCSKIRQVPRVLRKDYSSQRWWDDQTPAPKIDHTVSAWGNGFFYQFVKPFADPVPSVWTNQGEEPLKAGEQINVKIANGYAKYAPSPWSPRVFSWSLL